MEKRSMRFEDFLRPFIPSYILSIGLAIIGVFFGLLPYFFAYSLLLRLSKGCETQVVVWHAGAILLSFLLQLVLHSISTAISHKSAFSILKKMRLAVTEKMIRMPLGYKQKKGNGHFHHMLIDGIERLEYPLAHALPETTSNALLPLGIMGMLFWADYRMALAVFIPALLTLLFYLPMYTGIMNAFANTYYGDLENMNGRVIEYIRGNKEIKIFGKADSAISQYDHSIDKYKKSTLKLYNKMYFVTSPAFVLLSSITVSVLAVGGIFYTGGSLSASTYLLSIVVSIGIGAPLLKFTEFMDNFYHIKNGKRLVEDILSAPELKEATNINPNVLGNEIVLRDVNFSYDEKQVLNNINLTFLEGKKTAIVGPSGSGKTTIANLIARFWDSTSGDITLGGVNYQDMPLSQLMSHVNYVTQTPFLFNMSIRENIRMGSKDASDEDVEKAAHQAQCDEFITKLENGYETIVGNEGGKLSGGQKQRIVIARALLKNAPILILDEATAYADMENQRKIQASLEELCKGKTLIIIAHRLSTITDCAQIVLMENGEVRCVGSHDELLKKDHLYQKMWSIQKQSQNWRLGEREEAK